MVEVNSVSIVGPISSRIPLFVFNRSKSRIKVRHRRSSVSEVFGTLFYTFSIFSSPPVNFGVTPGLVSHRLFIPTCGS